MIGTWTPPGVIITVSFDDETLELELVKKTEIPEDEPISWMAFDVCAAWQLKTKSTRIDK
jgi:carboxy-cis,cis-muconate cyclase